MFALFDQWLRPLTLCTVLVLASCASKDEPVPVRDDPFRPGSLDERRVDRLSVEQLYASARAALDSSDYATALELYNRLDASFPFSRHAIQGKLESIYAQYRSFQPELALAGADRFLRANPRHEHIDYVLYLRGLVNFERNKSDILDLFDIDSTKRDPLNERRAFEDFSRLVQRFPESSYAADAHQRMIYLKNRIAQHEFGIAQYYAKRRAWIAASRRSLDIIERYQGSAILPQVLDLLATCYDELELPEKAAEIRQVKAASFGDAPAADEAAVSRRPARPPELPLG